MFKNIKRKIASITAMVCMLTTVLFGNVNVSAEVLHLEESGYFSYEINNDEAMITFYQLGTTDDTLTIPNQINGYTVVEISEKAFFMQPTIKEVIIPESVRNIGVQAFGYVQDEETYKKINGFTIKGYTGTAAEVYAEDNGFTFVAVDEETAVTTAVQPVEAETTTTTVSPTVSTTVSETTTESTLTTVSTSISLQTSVTVMTYVVERFGYFTIDNYPDKLSYIIGEELDLNGLEMTIKYYPGGFTANPNNIYYYTAVENVNPLNYPDLFVVDTSAFDNTKCGEYTITITPTEECKKRYYTFVAKQIFTVTVTESDFTTTELTTSSATETTVTTSTTTATQSVVTGDADEDNELTVRDCAYIASMLASGTGDKLPKTADFNGDGIVNVRDAASIAKKLAEKNL